MNKFLKIAAVVAAGIMFAGNAVAGGLYVVGGVTAANLNVDTDTTGLDRAAGANLGIGYDINEWLAVEGTYDYLGSNDFTYRSVRDTFDNTAQVPAKYDARAFTGWVVVDPTIVTLGSMPLKAIGRIGYANTKVNFTGGSATDNQLAYGAGVGLGVTENVDVVLDYRTYNVTNDDRSGGINTIGLGAKYTF